MNFPEFEKRKLVSLEHWRQVTQDFAINILKERHAIEPALFCYFDDSRLHMVMPLGELMNYNKDAMAMLLRKICRTQKPDGIIFVSEAWMKVVKAKTDEEFQKAKNYKGSLGDDPDRIESLIIQYEDANKAVMRTFDIERNDKEEVVGLGKCQETQTMEGRLTNFLNKRPEMDEN